jgi:fatty acyl-CoA reductase
MCRIQHRITQGLDLLSFFAMRNWHFKSDNFQNIHKKILTKEEHEMFLLDTVVDDDMVVEYLKNAMLGGRQYILKEPLSSLPKARIQLKL